MIEPKAFLRNKGQEPIAIVGMSCRLPGSNTVEEYWKTLITERCAVEPLPPGRWTSEQSCNISPEHHKTEAGWLNCAVDEFDAKFFGMSPMELTYTDPQQRLLLEVAWEAFEDAGINPENIRGTNTSVFTGRWTQEYKELMIRSGFSSRDKMYRSYMGNSLGNCTN
jgi:acyl transferase domain-containing protein